MLPVVNAMHSTSSSPVAPPVLSGMMQSESLKPSADSSEVAPRVSARMDASDVAAVSKFFGTEDDKNHVVDRMDRYEAFVNFSLKSRVGMTEGLIDTSLMPFFLYVIKDKTIVFHTQLMSSLVPWRRSADLKLLPDDEAKSIPTSWSQVKLAFESTYLSADAVARSVEDTVTTSMTDTNSVTSFTNIVTSSASSAVRQRAPEFPS